MLRTVMAIAKRRSPPRRSARLLTSCTLIYDSLLTAEQDGVPTSRRQLNRLLLKRSPRVQRETHVPQRRWPVAKRSRLRPFLHDTRTSATHRLRQADAA